MKATLLICLLIILFLCPQVQPRENMEQSDEFLQKAIEFHGHLGPYLVLGLRAGLYANQILGKQPMKTEAFIKTRTSPPQSCFADGVQFSTGCTFGKRNISLTEGEGLQVIFEKNDQKLILKLREEVIEEINSLPPQEEAWEELAKDLYKREIKDIFEVTPPTEDK